MKPSAPSRRLFIDDDTAGEIEVLPAAVADWCAAQLVEIDRFAARHEMPDGTGWSDIYVRPAAPAGISDLRIPFLPAAEALGRALPPIEEVIIGDPGAPQVLRNARAFGPSPLSAIVLYRSEGAPHVTAIELTLRGNADERLAVFSALAVLPSPEPLIVVDWAGARIVRVGDQSVIAKFAGTDDTA